jgi:hypothetical protein
MQQMVASEKVDEVANHTKINAQGVAGRYVRNDHGGGQLYKLHYMTKWYYFAIIFGSLTVMWIICKLR